MDSTANLPKLIDFEKIKFFQKTIFFKKKNQISCVFEKSTISVGFYGKFAKIWWWKVFKFAVEHRTFLIGK